MSTQAVTKWGIDPAHSEIGFKVKHLMISTVTGKFDKFEGSAESNGDDFADAKVSFTADTASVNTNNAQRDGHIQSAEFFDAAKFPQLKFTGTKFEKAEGEKYVLNGDLTIRDVTKPVKLDVVFEGLAKDPYGNIKAAFSITGKVNRTDFGLNWNVPLETGVLLSEEVRFQIEVQLLKQA